MDENEVWQALQDVVESGRESNSIDLKQDHYNLQQDLDKGEFIKDIAAIANSLEKQEQRGYLVIGVKDVKECPRPSEVENYTVGVTLPNLDETQRQMNAILREYLEPGLTVRCESLRPSGTSKDLFLIVIPSWLSINPTFPRPFFCRKGIGKIRRGQVFIRAESSVEAALYDDVSRLIHQGLIARINELQTQLEREVKRRYDELGALRDDFQQENQWLYDRISDLEKDRDELSRKAGKWRDFARAVSRELSRQLPPESHEKVLRPLFSRFGLDKYYSELQ